MTGSGDQPTRDQLPDDQPDDSPAGVPAPPVAQETTDGTLDAADFAERLDVDPERDDVKG